MSQNAKNVPLTRNQIVKERIKSSALALVSGVAIGTIAYYGAKAGARDYLRSGKLRVEVDLKNYQPYNPNL